MNINDVFPSNYLKASDLQGRDATVTIANSAVEKIGTDNKLVLFFQGKQKGMVLNKTNAQTIAGVFGPETTGWYGRQITLMAVWTDYQGKQVQAIRVRPAFPDPQQQPMQQPAQGTPTPPFAGQPHPGLGNPPGHPDLNDQVPF